MFLLSFLTKCPVSFQNNLTSVCCHCCPHLFQVSDIGLCEPLFFYYLSSVINKKKKTFPIFQGKVLGYACLGVLPKEYGSSCRGYRQLYCCGWLYDYVYLISRFKLFMLLRLPIDSMQDQYGSMLIFPVVVFLYLFSQFL